MLSTSGQTFNVHCTHRLYRHVVRINRILSKGEGRPAVLIEALKAAVKWCASEQNPTDHLWMLYLNCACRLELSAMSIAWHSGGVSDLLIESMQLI